MYIYHALINALSARACPTIAQACLEHHLLLSPNTLIKTIPTTTGLAEQSAVLHFTTGHCSLKACLKPQTLKRLLCKCGKGTALHSTYFRPICSLPHCTTWHGQRAPLCTSRKTKWGAPPSTCTACSSLHNHQQLEKKLTPVTHHRCRTHK